ncbi:MAG TPA: pyridoxamine 5'-phosphate oxidase family protein [Bosea sp. (in: a-proteobacteria)]|jgi:general stress protein 26|uniref:pyridoxamine 5'-phosphate oxidase family protein n=1 Tax=Bosea sp. (in: a-proteobacteria) TaxID=1871050 RepID=UPI002DDCBB90|nr:pyridoxamine 5'-phosphate oxidase family protein [Bosea sp. (in: a-proteobacteria)]HEV2554047.1 pyridoxamine 5'-phosphate oxidase family protein [Bosea sp. (in: a-proteobacteria)]
MSDTDLQEAVWAALERLSVCMVTTAAENVIRTRPMSGHVDRDNHRILFIIHRHAGIVTEAGQSAGVSIALSEEHRNFHAAIRCSAVEIEDRELLASIWTPMTGAWFPRGPEDPDATLLALAPISADIWNGPSSGVLVAFKLATARLLGRQPDLGVNTTIDMR